MTDERLILAIGRIERALARLEAGPSAAPHDDDVKALQARLDAMESRHGRLRESASHAVARLDRLIDAKAG